MLPYFAFLQAGFTLPMIVTNQSGSLLHCHFTLTGIIIDNTKAVYFLLHFPLPHGTWLLTSALPFEVRTFLLPKQVTA